METKSIGRLLSLLELGGQTALVRIYPLVDPPSNGALPGPSGWPLGNSSPAPSAAPWYADLYIHMGQLQYSAVFSASGERRLIGEQALNFLGQMGGLSYEMLPIPARPGLPTPEADSRPPSPQPPDYAGPYGPSPGPAPPAGYTDPYGPPQGPAPPAREMAWFPPRPSSSAASWRPARTRWGDLIAQNPQRLSRDQRRILALINGQRSVDELSRLLGFSSESLLEILTFFREQNLIS